MQRPDDDPLRLAATAVNFAESGNGDAARDTAARAAKAGGNVQIKEEAAQLEAMTGYVMARFGDDHEAERLLNQSLKRQPRRPHSGVYV